MSTTIRQKLIDYITVVDEKKTDSIFNFLQSEINKETTLSVITNELRTPKGLPNSSIINQDEIFSKKVKNFEFKTLIKDLQPLLTEILDKKYVIVSVVGSHAGKCIDDIFLSKINEVKKNSKTYWLLRSAKAKTIQIQRFCEQAKMEGEDVYCLFINPSAKNGARDTITDTMVKDISHNNSDWFTLANNVQITGIISHHSTALVLSELGKLDEPVNLDLWDYSEFPAGEPIRFQLGTSTAIAKKIPSEGMKSRFRKLVAWGKLEPPFAVWIR